MRLIDRFGLFPASLWLVLAAWLNPGGSFAAAPFDRAKLAKMDEEIDQTIAQVAAEAVVDFDFASVPGAPSPAPETAATRDRSTNEVSNEVSGVLNGIDVLVKRQFAPLKGMRLGLITNHTGKNRQRYSTIHLLKNAPEVQLKALFSPEHGLYGNFDEAVSDSVDEVTGLPIISLYGKHRAPTPEQLRNLDALVFDIQDIGCRFYT